MSSQLDELSSRLESGVPPYGYPTLTNEGQWGGWTEDLSEKTRFLA